MERIKPKLGIMDKITPAQGKAWQFEHEALLAPDLAKGYYRAQARDIRFADHLERKRQLYTYADAQNELLDAIAEVEGRGAIIPIFDGKELAPSGSR